MKAWMVAARNFGRNLAAKQRYLSRKRGGRGEKGQRERQEKGTEGKGGVNF